MFPEHGGKAEFSVEVNTQIIDRIFPLQFLALDIDF